MVAKNLNKSLQGLGTDVFETSLSIFLHRISFGIPMVNDLSPQQELRESGEQVFSRIDPKMTFIFLPTAR